ncbi:MAG: ATP-binding protein [Myxococcota bacterium]
MEGFLAVLSRREQMFEAVYPCGHSGQSRWSSVQVFPVEADGLRAMVLHADVTELAIEKRQLREVSDYLSMATASLGIGTWGIDLTTNRLEWDRRMYEIHGVSPRQFNGDFDAWTSRLHSKDVDEARRAFQMALEGKSFFTEFRIVRGNETRWIRATATVPTSERKAPTRVVGCSWDVTEQRSAQHELQSILETSSDAVLVLNAAELVVRANSSAEVLFGRSRDELIGLPFAEIKPDGLLMCASRTAPQACVLRTPLEPGRDVSCTAYQVNEDPTCGWVVAVHEVTDVSRVREELEKAERLGSLGRLAGGVAHDFNNLLTAMFAYIEVLEDDVAGQSSALGTLREMQAVAERAKELTDQLLVVGRRDPSHPMDLILNSELRGIQQMLKQLLPESIQLHVHRVPRLGVRLARSELHQLILNLVVNARDAICGAGSIWLTARTDRRREFAIIEVRDDGCGIEAETKKMVFEPFFTTKEQGKGTGLGLAIVHEIASRAGGFVDVESEIGIGTLFRVHLPLVENEAIRTADLPETPALQDRKLDVHAVLVEDDDWVRRAVESQLQNVVRQVTSFASGADAFAYATQVPVDVLVTDVLMPEMTGPELAGQIEARLPKLPIVFMSGDADSDWMASEVGPVNAQFIAKPFRTVDLRTALEDVLDCRQGA